MTTMKKKTITAIALLAATLSAKAFSFSMPDDVIYMVRLGYSIGGTAPMGIPATIRSMNSYKPQSNLSLAIDAQKKFDDRWGIMLGLKIENKGMEVDATVKNYHMEMVQDGKRLAGYYTGNNVISTEGWLVTLPVRATYNINDKLLVRLGPFVSYVQSASFDGYVYSGYLREGTPTGTKIVMGDTKETGATYDFADDLRHFQFGFDVGVDWNFYRRWGLYADISWGVTNIFKKDFNTIEQKLYPVYGTLGVSYRLK